MLTKTPTQQLTWLIEMAEMQKKTSQFATLFKILNEIEAELQSSEGDLDDQMYCEVAFYLAKNYEQLGYVGRAMEYYEQASLFAPEVSAIEEKALIREVGLKSFLRLSQDLEPTYIYLKSFDQEEDFHYLISLGFSELAFDRPADAHKYFDKALKLKSASENEKRQLFFQLLEQELLYGYNFSKLVKLQDLTMFTNLSAYEQSLIFILTQDVQALQFLGSAWFAKMSPAESLKASFMLSQVKKFKLAWAYKPMFYQHLSQFDFHTQSLWKNFFEKSCAMAAVTA